MHMGALGIWNVCVHIHVHAEYVCVCLLMYLVKVWGCVSRHVHVCTCPWRSAFMLSPPPLSLTVKTGDRCLALAGHSGCSDVTIAQ